MIVFVDGVDGSGKSTLIQRMLIDLRAQARPVSLASPLWKFLEHISAPQDFAPWVEATAGLEVARALLASMAKRIDSLAKLSTEPSRRTMVVLVDRGPKTVLCSALAHIRTGIPVPNVTQEDEMSVEHHRTLLAEQITRLLAVNACVSVELHLNGQAERIFKRLAQLESLSPAYLRYLHTFADEMQSVDRWPGLPSLPLSATDSVDYNVAQVTSWLTNV
jgi:thymidylate kinase